MFSSTEIEDIINAHIKAIEKTGDRGSSSGHLSSVSIILNKFSYRSIENESIKIQYSYTKYIETEFTYYPDNPPHEYHISREMIIDKNKNVLFDAPAKHSNAGD